MSPRPPAQRFRWRRARRVLLGVLVCIVLVYGGLWLTPPVRHEPAWGVQFSRAHAEWMGLDWRVAYEALLDDVGVRSLRLGAYWNEVEPQPGVFDFTALDWMLDAAALRNADVVLAVGRRLPRWPECHVPSWASVLPEDEQRAQLLRYLAMVVQRYRGHQAVAVWQVENEPLLTLFGECPEPSFDFLAQEVELVRSIDPDRRILITDSGELSLWMRTASVGELLGTTMYRVVWNRLVGYWSYDAIIPPAFYRLKAWAAGKPREQMIVAELQAEPWIPRGDIFTTTLDEQRKSMDAARFQKHVAFARATGFPAVYLWGAEYWYWLKTEHGDPSLWEEARVLFGGERPEGERSA